MYGTVYCHEILHLQWLLPSLHRDRSFTDHGMITEIIDPTITICETDELSNLESHRPPGDQSLGITSLLRLSCRAYQLPHEIDYHALKLSWKISLLLPLHWLSQLELVRPDSGQACLAVPSVAGRNNGSRGVVG